MANIIKRVSKTGKVSYKISVSYKDGSGKFHLASVTFHPTRKTEGAQLKEAQAFAVEYEKKIKGGRAFNIQRIKFSDFVPKWEKEWASNNLTEGQKEQYLNAIKRIAIPAIGSKEIAKIIPNDIQEIANTLINEGKKPATIRKYLTCINSVFAYAYHLDLIKENPTDRVSLPKIEKDEECHYFDEEQARYFLDSLDKTFRTTYKAHDCVRKNGSIYHVPAYTEEHHLSTQLQLLFTMAIMTGCRRGELLALQWSDVDLEHKTISITKAVSETKKDGIILKAPKTRAGIRMLSIPTGCIDLLKKWKHEEAHMLQSSGEKWEGASNIEIQPLFIQSNGKRMDIRTPYHSFEKFLRIYNDQISMQIEEMKNDAQLSDQKKKEKIAHLESKKLPKIHFHDLRHTSISVLVASGCDPATVAKRAGHAKISTTMNIYTHALPEKDKDASKALDKVFS